VQVFNHFHEYNMKILLGDFNAKLRKEDIFKPKIGSNNVLQDSSDNGVRIVNFATPKNLVVKNMMFQQQNIRTFTSASPDGKTHNQTDHILTDGRWHSHMLNVQSLRGTDSHNDHYLVFAKVREILVVSKQEAQQLGVERFNLRKLLSWR